MSVIYSVLPGFSCFPYYRDVCNSKGVRNSKGRVDCNFYSRQSQGMQRLNLATNLAYFFFLSVENVCPV